ncbi:MAG: aldehyde ferredoxin oxidoreductase family protein [Atribacterota bacterium]|nr:aldehyde ferredoxin oxidoreductase family protein [Atribacterota bacterium]MDD4896628.1 aldehyde ferredoxin oxidoreductase family protein [Atribacterota bacterium]MDD5636653.1 aldehyde ferredoxin oxidoreductase family protein [Atribacterota bacterium]
MNNILNYSSNQLRISLSDASFKLEKIPEKVLQNYLGGVGYAAKVLYEELNEGIDPLSPENKLIFATGPLTSYQVPGGGSIEICFKSPLTKAWGESRCGGDFGPELKKASYDFLIVEGKSSQPVYLFIHDKQVEFRNANHLVGKKVSEKTRIIREELEDQDISIMCIGIAGENLVSIASIMSEDRAAGRCGAGAVMGSKNLIAIAVKGSDKLQPKNPEDFNIALKEVRKVLKESEFVKGLRQFGTIGDMAGNDAAGDWPTKNWQSNSWGKAEKLYDHYLKNNFVKNKMCYKGCPIACGRVAKVEEGRFKTPQHEGAEYESVSAFTAFVFNQDMDAAIHSTYLCNELGIDTISAGAVIAFAMECYEHKLISKEEADGLDLSWGNPEVLPILVDKIVQREGLGNLLADGVARAAQKIGPQAEEYAVHGKGLEGPAHDPRSGKLLAVTYGTANRGMCHIHPLEGMAYDSGKITWGMTPYGVPDPNQLDRWDEKGKGAITKTLQDGLIMPDVLGVCKFFMYAGITLEHYAKILSALTGWQLNGADLLRIGERVNNLQRLFNIREGIGRKNDLLHERVKSLPQFGLYHKEEKCAIKDYEGMLKEYYQARGWDSQTGIPKQEKLRELGLNLV